MTGRQESSRQTCGQSSIDLYWLPLGAGGRCVRISGRLYEALIAGRAHRAPARLYHSALIVRLDGETFTIEMTPVWAMADPHRGVAAEGPVGMSSWGRSRLFRYEIRCWRDGTIPDLAAAVDSPRRLSNDEASVRRLLRSVPFFPTATWGRDEQRTGEMWNSNSLTSWLLARSGLDAEATEAQPPQGGRAPGWSAGLSVASRADCRPGVLVREGRSRPRRPRVNSRDADDRAAAGVCTQAGERHPV